jgi:hypothetical protein
VPNWLGIEIAHISVKFPHTVRKNVQGLSANYYIVTKARRMDKYFLHIGMNNISSSRRYCPTYTTVTVPKIRHKSNFAHVGNEHTNSQLYISIAGSPAAILKAIVWKLFGRRKTVPRSVLFSCHFRDIALSLPQEKIRHVWKILLIRVCTS